MFAAFSTHGDATQVRGRGREGVNKEGVSSRTLKGPSHSEW